MQIAANKTLPKGQRNTLAHEPMSPGREIGNRGYYLSSQAQEEYFEIFVHAALKRRAVRKRQKISMNAAPYAVIAGNMRLDAGENISRFTKLGKNGKSGIMAKNVR